jgi:hypothetical protein
MDARQPAILDVLVVRRQLTRVAAAGQAAHVRRSSSCPRAGSPRRRRSLRPRSSCGGAARPGRCPAARPRGASRPRSPTMPCGPPKPRKAVFEALFVRTAGPRSAGWGCSSRCRGGTSRGRGSPATGRAPSRRPRYSSTSSAVMRPSSIEARLGSATRTGGACRSSVMSMSRLSHTFTGTPVVWSPPRARPARRSRCLRLLAAEAAAHARDLDDDLVLRPVQHVPRSPGPRTGAGSTTG